MKKVKKNSLILIVVTLLNGWLNAQTLDTLLQRVVEGNLDLKRLQLEYEAELTKKQQVSQLPNPQAGVGIPVSTPETRLGPQVLMISASQMFPWFGTLKLKEELVIAISKVKYEKIAALKLNLFHQVKAAYYKLYFIKRNQEILKETIKRYESIESIALAKIEGGFSNTADVLRIQSKLLSIRQEQLILDNRKKPLESKINELTKQPLSNSIVLDDSLQVSHVLFDVETYRSKIEQYHPLIIQIDYEIESSQKQIEVNENINKPVIGIGVDYSFVEKRTDANPRYNGRDILVPKFMVSLPLYRKAYKAKNAEEKINQEALLLKKESLTDRMISMLITYQSDYNNAVLLEELAKKQKDIITSAYDVLVANYSSSGMGFEELLMVQNQLFSLDLDMFKAKLEANLAINNIERIADF